jgi:hypothetical protein
MEYNFSPIATSLVFLVVNIIILLAILYLNQRTGAKSGQGDQDQEGQNKMIQGQKVLGSSDILGWEYGYARTTASEAMQDRHTMINFYLVIVGVLTTGVVAVLARDTDFPNSAATALLWVLCGVGWLYFLKIIRLRQAWHDSARAMNQIKDFYIQHAKDFDPNLIRHAFRWGTQTLPPPEKPWTLFFYSAMLIGFLDSAAYVAGGVLINLDATLAFPFWAGGLLVLFGLVFFAFHVWLYFAFLKKPSPVATDDVSSKV